LTSKAPVTEFVKRVGGHKWPARSHLTQDFSMLVKSSSAYLVNL
jgi:hypothetical protein